MGLRGFQKGNKFGYRKKTFEIRQKISNSLKGKPSGAKGKHWKLSDETKRRMSETAKKQMRERGKWNWGLHNKGEKRNCGINHKPKFHTEETKNKIRIARLKQILPTIDTSIERKFKEWLESKKINYIHSFNLGNRFQCDFYLPSMNLIVECDGTYWHNREDMKKRDKAKDAYAKKCGFNLIRLSEEQINQGRFF